jgi:hypothetical protein
MQYRARIEDLDGTPELDDVDLELSNTGPVKSWSGKVFLKPGEFLYQRAYTE